MILDSDIWRGSSYHDVVRESAWKTLKFRKHLGEVGLRELFRALRLEAPQSRCFRLAVGREHVNPVLSLSASATTVRVRVPEVCDGKPAHHPL